MIASYWRVMKERRRRFNDGWIDASAIQWAKVESSRA